MSNENTTATESKEIKFKDDLVQLSGKLAPLYVADKDAATLVLPKEAFFVNAPEGVTPESYELHHKYEDLFNNAATHAALAPAVAMFKEHKAIETITVTAPVHGKDSYEAVFKRNGSSRNPSTGDVTNFVGSVSVARLNIVSTRTKSESNGIKSTLRSLAEAAGL